MLKPFFALLISALLLTSCASGPTVSEQITPAALYTFSPNSDLRSNITVGKITNETGLFGTSHVDSSDYKEALEKALSHNGLLASSPSSAGYQLDATFEYDMESPKFLDHLVKTKTIYTLRQTKNNETAFTRTIETSDLYENEARKELGVIGGLLFTSPAVQQGEVNSRAVNTARHNISNFLAELSKWRK